MGEFASSAQLTLSPYYYSAVNAITQPDRMVFCSVYLIEKWLPDLGGDGLAILLFLRRRCYHNRRTGELRNKITVSLAEVGRGCNLGVNTVRRHLQNNTALRAFVSSQEEYIVEAKRGGVIQTGNAYTVSMDDPVHPGDAVRLEEEMRCREADTLQEPQDAKLRARQQAHMQRQSEHSPAKHATPSHFGRALPADSQNGGALLQDALSQNGRALREEQRTPKMGDESNHYYTLPKPIETTTTPRAFSEQEEGVVVFPAALEKALIAAGVTPKMAGKLLRTYSEETVRQQLEWLPQRRCNDPAATLVEAIKESYGPPATARKPLPRPRPRASNSSIPAPPVASEGEAERVRTALAEARRKVRSLQ